ncbi:hypothetical protein C7B62_04950 [Pleurocapsa sp. CCALA 161]|uniref:hypothetical protein n=1 Tax=Pleurocapsa sp. CCALA 161 TaxID=2107688 RepID=UPI000D04A3D4|nr:hypothetical protein [Pleurocapsa sp. CCALA 161]PSB11604.1 hypothetical protein C7B62_04950 [Pleurocapsa sp. CCALA 161]
MLNPLEPIKSNQSLNKTPKKGNLVSEELAGPLIAIIAIAFLAGLFGAPISWCVGFVLWSGFGWLLFAGRKPYIQIAKLTKKPPKWTTARIKYEPRENIPLKKNDHY